MIKLSPRYFILPLIALVVIGSLPAPADTGGRAARSTSCGPALTSITDPAMRATFDQFERTQSAAATKICAVYRNSMEPGAR